MNIDLYGGIGFSSDMFKTEEYLLKHLRDHYPLTIDPNELSLYEMCIIVNGKEWADAYREYIIHRFP